MRGFLLGRGKFELSASEDGALRFRKLGTVFRLVSAKGCTPYPEAGPGATGRPFRGTNPDGTVFGFADTHLHITANLRAGGRVIHGEPFDRFGITEALGHDEDDHGADGSQDVTGNLLRTGLPFGTHDTHGWPTFAGWPTNDTNTHQQVYYSWLQRAYDSGLRFVVAQTVEDQPICRIEPMRSHSCNEMHTIKLEVQELEGLQNYVDAQSGGPGRRLVPPRLQRAPGPPGDRAGQARGRDRGRVVRPVQLLRARRVPAQRRGPGPAQAPPARRPHAVRRPLGRQRVRRRGPRGRHEGRLHQHLQPGRDRPLLQHRPLPRPEPGRGGEHDRAGRDADPRSVLPRRGRDPADAGIPRGQAVQLEGPDEARRLSGQADDEDRDADRGRPHERAGARPGPRDHRPPPLSRDLGPHRHRRRLDAEGAPHALPQRRPRLGDPRPGPAARAARSSPSASTRARSTTSGSAWAPTPAASRRCPAPATTRPRIRSPTRSSPTTARSPSPASTPATATSTSTPTGSPTTACSPTSSRTCSAARTARRPCARSSARPRPICRCGRSRGRGADRAQAVAISSAARSPDATAPSR